MSGAEILLQPGVFPRLLQGLWVTVWIAGVSVGASIPVGLLVGWLMTLKNPVIRAAMRIYLDFIRIMPQLALLFLAYYGFARWFDWNLDATGACVLVFILWGAPSWAIWCVAHCSRFPKCSTNRATYWG